MEAMSEFISESSDEELLLQAIRNGLNTQTRAANGRSEARETQLRRAVERYYVTRSNLFLQMQQEDPISDSIQHERDAISKESLLDQLRLDFTRAAMEVKLYSSQPSIQQNVPPPDNCQVPYRELPYFTWFVKEGPTFFGLQHLFPTSMGRLYALSVNHPVLYHAILAVSTHFVDAGMQRETGLDDHLGGILQQIQDAIVNEQFNDGHIYALFLLGAMYIFRSKFDLGAKYLYGMSLMIKRAESKRRRRGDDTGKSPLIGFVLRVAISLLNRVPVEQQWLLEVDFNLLKAEMEDTWVDDLTKGGYQAGLARATYILNQCMFSILRLTHFVTGVRASQQYNPHLHESQINFEVGKIATILRQLQDRLATQARGPTIGVAVAQPPQEVFEPVSGITDISFGYRLMASYMLMIALTFVQNPRIGLISQQRYDAALDLCRTYAAVQGTRSICPNLPVLTSLWFAGLTFGPRTHLAEYQWIKERFEKLDVHYYPNAPSMGQKLDQIWNQGDTKWYDVSWTRDRRFELFGGSVFRNGINENT